MPIKIAQPLHIGNAVRLWLAPSAGSTKWRLLRKGTGTFTGYNDPGASVIHEGRDAVVLDTQALVNGQTYHYGLFVFNGLAWVADGVVSAMPAVAIDYFGPDVLTVVRDRVDLGLQHYIDSGAISHQDNKVPVLTAPPLFGDTVFPAVTVHLQTDQSGDRGVGELIVPDAFNMDAGQWEETEGMLTRVQLIIMIWSLNPDERNALRRSVKAILIGNLPIFDDAGMVQVDISQSDTEDFQSYSAPLYQTMTTLSCLAPAAVVGRVGVIGDVVLTVR